LDVGANIGYLTGLFAIRVGLAGAVHAFEPHPKVQETLKRNIARVRLNPKSAPIATHVCALGDFVGEAQLIEPDCFQVNRGTARIAASEPGNELRSYVVAMETLDHLFAQESFDLVKIDVEGFEPRVFQGARRLLSERRIRHIVYEDHEVQSSSLARRLQADGYAVFSIGYDLFGPKLRAVDREISPVRPWESPNFLATIEPVSVKNIMAPRGWQVLTSF
jgi:FkbM family methyltransferase